jgi:hypothetical protein
VNDKDHKDDPGGYGGARDRALETPEHAFGDRGWADGRGGKEQDKREESDPGWQERFTRENAAKYGQAGGEPTEQRGPAQSTGGEPQEETNVGDTKDISPRGGVGIRETEKRPKDEK